MAGARKTGTTKGEQKGFSGIGGNIFGGFLGGDNNY
jgi:hypothetical protein